MGDKLSRPEMIRRAKAISAEAEAQRAAAVEAEARLEAPTVAALPGESPRATLVRLVSGSLHGSPDLTHEQCEAEAERVVAEYEGTLRAAPARAESRIDVARVLDWIRDPERKPATLAFTSGDERQIAYAVEMVLAPARAEGEAELGTMSLNEAHARLMRDPEFRKEYEQLIRAEAFEEAAKIAEPYYNGGDAADAIRAHARRAPTGRETR